MNLVIVHYHLRPGGIRRIIELATPYLRERLRPRVRRILLACGEAPDRKWNRAYQAAVGEVPVEFVIEPTFNYVSEQPVCGATLKRGVQAALSRLFKKLGTEPSLVWAHNLGIGRNLFLTGELARACEAAGIPLVAHHHDWWFDNRWLRWPEMRECGFRSLAAVAQTIFPSHATLRHVAINHADASLLERYFDGRAAWVPNLMERPAPPSAEAVQQAARWLQHHLGEVTAPVWILPCRLLRRKNVAEALLLTRWLRPEAWLVVTGGVSSADEQAYADKLGAAARRHHWRLRLGVLAGDETRKPTVPELLAASECVMLTSIQEGFGLPYLEAAVAGRPLIARALPNIAPDLHRFGLRFPQYYREILVAPDLFDWPAERRRQARLFADWCRALPRACQSWVGTPALLAAGESPCPVPFSRLTLSAQLEVLEHPARESWAACQALNPFLVEWKERAAAGELGVTQWPPQADRWLSGPAYARRLARAVSSKVPPTNHVAIEAQAEFIRAKLDAQHLFPLLWSRET